MISMAFLLFPIMGNTRSCTELTLYMEKPVKATVTAMSTDTVKTLAEKSALHLTEQGVANMDVIVVFSECTPAVEKSLDSIGMATGAKYSVMVTNPPPPEGIPLGGTNQQCWFTPSQYDRVMNSRKFWTIIVILCSLVAGLAGAA